MPHPFDEEFEIDSRPGQSILFGKFRVNGQIIQVSHSQWEEDSYQLSVTQRKEILRKTLVERLKKYEKLALKNSKYYGD